jgi:hypothetical protein
VIESSLPVPFVDPLDSFPLSQDYSSAVVVIPSSSSPSHRPSHSPNLAPEIVIPISSQSVRLLFVWFFFFSLLYSSFVVLLLLSLP